MTHVTLTLSDTTASPTNLLQMFGAGVINDGSWFFYERRTFIVNKTGDFLAFSIDGKAVIRCEASKDIRPDEVRILRNVEIIGD